MKALLSHMQASELPLTERDDHACELRARSYSSSIHLVQPSLLAYLVSRAGGDFAAAEDCLQEVAVAVWKKFDPQWDAEHFRRFAFRCADIECRRLHRRKATEGKRTVSLSPDVLELVGRDIRDSPCEDSGLQRARVKALNLCLDALDAGQRELIDARYADGGGEHPANSLADIASRRGVKMDSIYKRLERLRDALGKCIDKRMSAE
ncbi:MAG: sigma-70 family RNA polymerase sigma factor [Akkermansiaceae bacterium]|nr:sigma-70 family RNA polymerase sigma factor [Akkermansiaceae bacterium]